MNKGQAILLLESVEDEYGMKLYRVTTNRGSMTFLSPEDAKTYAGKVLVNGTKKPSVIKTARKSSPHGGFRPTVSDAEVKARREFILNALSSSSGLSMRGLIDKAKSSSDPVIRKVPMGSWSSILSSMKARKKIGVIGRGGRHGKLVYRTL